MKLNQTALTVVQEIVRRGGRLSILGGCIEVRAPKGAIPQSLRDELTAHKPEILELELWNVEEIRIPRVDGEGVDVWKVIRRFDGKPDSWSMWYAGSEDSPHRNPKGDVDGLRE